MIEIFFILLLMNVLLINFILIKKNNKFFYNKFLKYVVFLIYFKKNTNMNFFKTIKQLKILLN